MWDYLNALASGDVWIIIQPFFRRLEPQAAAVSRRRRRRWGGIGRRWKWGEGGEAVVTSWGETKKTRNMWREWNPLENLNNQRWTSSQTLHMCVACTMHTCAHTQYTLTRFYWQTHAQHLHIKTFIHIHMLTSSNNTFFLFLKIATFKLQNVNTTIS